MGLKRAFAVADQSIFLNPCQKGILAIKHFCSKSEVGVCVCVKLFQRLEVDNSLPVLNAGRRFTAPF